MAEWVWNTATNTSNNCACSKSTALLVMKHKERSGRPLTATTVATSAVVQFTRSPLKSVKQCSRESNIQRILKSENWKVYIPRLLHSMNEDDTDRLQYCKWFESMMRDEAFAGKVVWSDEAQFKLNGTVNRHNCVLVLWKSAHSSGKRRKFTGTYCVVWFVIPEFDWTILLWRHWYRCTVSRFYRHQYYLPSESYMGTKAFTYKMVRHPTTIEMSGCIWMKLYLDDG